MNKRYIFAISLAVVLTLLIFLGIYQCPLKFLFGLSCPFCGITRAIYYALQLNFKKAFYYHLFWPIVLIGIIIHVLYEFKLITKYKKTMMIFLYIFVFINFFYYIYRFTNGSNIVYFDFHESLIYKIINLL